LSKLTVAVAIRIQLRVADRIADEFNVGALELSDISALTADSDWMKSLERVKINTARFDHGA
jgi:hypothetical protein